MDNQSMSELAEEYMQQYRVLKARVQALAPLRKELSGTALLNHDQKVARLNDMAQDCKITAYYLKNYYEED